MSGFDVKIFIIGLIIGLLLGIIGTCIYKSKESFAFGKFLDNLTVTIQKLWYVIILVASTIYIVRKYPECTHFTFFSDFNGDNLVFILYLMLLVLPLFDKLELFGVNLGFRWQNKLSKQAAEEVINSNEILSKEELQKLSSKKKGENNE